MKWKMSDKKKNTLRCWAYLLYESNGADVRDLDIYQIVPIALAAKDPNNSITGYDDYGDNLITKCVYAARPNTFMNTPGDFYVLNREYITEGGSDKCTWTLISKEDIPLVQLRALDEH